MGLNLNSFKQHDYIFGIFLSLVHKLILLTPNKECRGKALLAKLTFSFFDRASFYIIKLSSMRKSYAIVAVLMIFLCNFFGEKYDFTSW
ncbi:hypothetical protein DP114_16310 [Brasilonema sennae CENA114]|uniref:Uncharacterized protein n=1 Tax=Brasilonema sennae CENA114 TaxID=415709 RepID=A0A856MD88_9CYAN|nr:hypothetical protein DP114_16310 [Brasilonema sennae CENA114]